MSDLLNADNLPVIIGIVISANGLYFLKEIIDAVRAWRKGASDKERNILLDTLAQLERCNQDRDTAADERDRYRQQVGRRDFLLLRNGIDPPNDSGSAETAGTRTAVDDGRNPVGG